MENTLTVYEKSIYGTSRLFPKNEQAKRVARLLQTKTLSTTVIRDLRAIGFIVRIEIREEV